jgi:hypothetical protein
LPQQTFDSRLGLTSGVLERKLQTQLASCWGCLDQKVAQRKASLEPEQAWDTAKTVTFDESINQMYDIDQEGKPRR